MFDGWRYCPRCRAEIEASGGKVECGTCGLTVYASASPTACAAVLDGEGRILLARRAGTIYNGRWDLPGGFVEEGEHPHDAIRRELREESGLEVEPDAFVGVWTDTYSEDDSGQSTLNLYWTARVTRGELEPADDVAELRWFRLDELPPPEETAFHIAEVLRAVRDQHA